MCTVLKANSNSAVEALTDEDMEMLRRMLGADERYSPSSWGFRNHYTVTPDTANHASMERLRAAGYTKTSGIAEGGVIYYHATLEGCDALGFTKAQKQRAMDW